MKKLIEPFCFSIRSDNSIYAGTGAALEKLDEGSASHKLPGMSNRLKNMCDSARAAQQIDQFQAIVYVDHDCTYQRFIAAVSVFIRNGISMQQIQFTSKYFPYSYDED